MSRASSDGSTPGAATTFHSASWASGDAAPGPSRLAAQVEVTASRANRAGMAAGITKACSTPSGLSSPTSTDVHVAPSSESDTSKPRGLRESTSRPDAGSMMTPTTGTASSPARSTVVGVGGSETGSVSAPPPMAMPSWSSASAAGSIDPSDIPPSATEATSRPPSMASGTSQAWCAPIGDASPVAVRVVVAVTGSVPGVDARTPMATGTSAQASGRMSTLSGTSAVAPGSTVTPGPPRLATHRSSLVQASRVTSAVAVPRFLTRATPSRRWPSSHHAASVSVGIASSTATPGCGRDARAPGSRSV
jgi:hypothetical protein